MSKNQKTRNNIKNAFLELIKEMDLDAVNTKDIMERAGGARSNFYNYFGDKFDLSNAIMQDELKQMENLVNSFLRGITGTLSRDDLRELYQTRFDRIYENRDLYRTLFSISCFRDFPQLLRNSQLQLLDYRFRAYFQEDRESGQGNNEFRSYMMAALFTASIEYWVRTDFSMMPELFCEEYMKSFFPDRVVSAA